LTNDYRRTRVVAGRLLKFSAHISGRSGEKVVERYRLTIGSLMLVVAIAAIDCGFLLIPTHLAGGYLIGLSIQIALIPLLRSRGRSRFWIGFEAAGLMTLVIFMACRHALNLNVARWPAFLYESYRSALSSMSPAVVDWLLGHCDIFDPRGNLSVLQIVIVLEVTYGLPMLLLPVLGGFTAACFRPRQPVEGSTNSVPDNA
jgi:hypothetical protein